MADNYMNSTYPGVAGSYANPWSMQQKIPQNAYGLTCVLIQDENEVRSYPVAAGTSVFLMCLPQGKFWIKSTNTSGIPEPVRAFSFSEIIPETTPKVSDNSNYVTKKEFDELKKLIEDLVK